MDFTNLYELTHQESGIVIYGNSALLVVNWSSFCDNELPLAFSPLGIIPREHQDIIIKKEGYADDIKTLLPGTVWIIDDNTADTDMDIAYDINGDITALFNIQTGIAKPTDKAVGGEFFELSSCGHQILVIAPDGWN